MHIRYTCTGYVGSHAMFLKNLNEFEVNYSLINGLNGLHISSIKSLLFVVRDTNQNILLFKRDAIENSYIY